jgi:ribosomal protein S12 methylthiotransferase accessory factor
MTDGKGRGFRVGVLGAGRLHDAILASLGDGARAISPQSTADSVPPLFELLVAASDGWDDAGHAPARRMAESGGGVPWLPVRTELSHAVIGPMEMPGRAGCVACAGSRRHRIRPDRSELDAVRHQHQQRLARRPPSWLTGLAAQLVASLVAEEAGRLAAGAEPRSRSALLRVDLDRLTITRHRYLPEVTCPVCGDPAADTPEHGRVELTSRRAHRPGSYRARAIADRQDELVDTYVDEHSGLIRALNGWDEGALVVTSASVVFRSGRTESGYGRAASFRASRLTALLEALERYGNAPSRRTAVTASYAQVSDRALDPRTLGLHPPEQYEQPGFHYQPFSPEVPYRWVWGWSFARSEPVLVPELCAYYGAPHHGEHGHGFVFEISNGCALGSCLEEAILYGLLEVAERDAFLLTWYARLPAPAIDLATSRDSAVRLLAAAIRAETGYQVRAFDITVEQGIPCVWVVAVNPHQDGRPALFCTAGSHPDPERAVRNALTELGPGLGGIIRGYAQDGRAARARQMAADSALVREMADHSLLYADPVAASRLDFLLRSQRVWKVEDVGRPDRGGFASDDLRDNLLEAVGRYTDHGMDVIVVDQTAPEHRAGGFSCAKVLIPGTLSMTFGHQYRRVEGLPRLYQVPQLLGYRDQPLPPDEVNTHPHPFP